MSHATIDPALLDAYRDQSGRSLVELSQDQPALVVFLRHSGCTFCRQALADLKESRAAIAAAGAGIVLVHMQTDADAARLFAEYNLADVPRISDSKRRLYRAFDLQKGSMLQVVGPEVWGAGFRALLGGFFPGVPSGDVFQLPGAFLVHRGQIVRAFRAQTSADRPDYCELVRSAS